MTALPTAFSVTARWVFPVSSPPIERGVVEVSAGRIVAVHNRHDPRAIDLGNVAILPGMVNAHAHLEFSDLSQPVQPPLPFTDWIRALVAVRRSSPATADVLQQGLAESHSSGTTTIGEIATQDWDDDEYRRAGLDVIVFREIIGTLASRAPAQLETARRWLEHVPAANSSVIHGLSPHAPYSVRPDLYRDLVQLAATHRAPVAIHLAETLSELELLDHGTGEFVEMLKRFDAWDAQANPQGSRPLDYLKPMARLTRGLVIHGNYLQQAEIDWLAENLQVSVVYCPRTHAFFQHPPHPWLRLKERQINVALGTDGRGSNPDLSLWQEMRFLAGKFPRVQPSHILQMGTLAGARALGREAQAGSLEPGKQAGLAVVTLTTGESSDPWALLFESPLIADCPTVLNALL